MIPNNITRKHLEKAIEEIDRDGVKKGRHSSTYDLIYNGKPYPPKLVISIANKFANNSELSPNIFGGGKGTTAFNLLKKEGFTIKEKQPKINPLYTILTKIKSDVEKAGFQYKSFNKKARYVWIEDSENIIGRSIAHYELISRKNTLYIELHFEEEKSKDLFHKSINKLPTQLKWFNWNGSKSIRHKNSYSLNEKDIEKKIVYDLIEFDSLIGKQIRTIISDKTKQYWLYSPGENAYLWDEFNSENIIGLGWDEIGNLSQYKNRDEIKKALVNSYGGTGSKKNDVSANYDFLKKIKIGDIIIAKKGRKELLGYGIITTKYIFEKDREKYQSIRRIDWKLKGSWNTDHALVLKTLTDITKYDSKDPKFDSYYEKLMDIMGVKNLTNDYQEEFRTWLTQKYGENSNACSSYIQAIKILSKILKKSLFQTTNDSYLKSLYEDLLEKQKDHNSKYFISDAPSYGTHGFYSASVKSYREFLKNINSNKESKNNNMKFSLNTILYGPPGTGKTYNTILRAAQIIKKQRIDSYDDALKIFKDNLHDTIEFITFHQNYSYEDFIQGLRPDTENDNQLTFERQDGIFKQIADKALKNLIESEKPQILQKSFEEVFSQFINPLLESETEEIEVKMKNVSYFITGLTNKSIEFRKSSGGTSHSLSIATLKKMYLAESVLEMQGLRYYYAPLLNHLLKNGKDSSGKKKEIEKKNYVIIIDEINRANISRVFGELITLIEPDKRSHGAIPLEARLPSGDSFIVPSNLFIIGTMNTADKSIALLDIALRRRFEFESMYPKYKIKDKEIYDVEILKKINEQVIKSKGHDFQIGHSYFMGKNNDLIERMNKKVIPLLLEYYMNDEKEVKSILNTAGLKIEKDSWPLKVIGKND